MEMTDEEAMECFAKAIDQLPNTMTDRHIVTFISALIYAFADTENEAGKCLIETSMMLQRLFEKANNTTTH